MYFIKDTISVSLSTSSTSVIYGSDAVLTATITSNVSVSSIIWQRVPSGGSPINLNITDEKYTQKPSEVGPGQFILTIGNTDKTDRGTYQVQVNNTAGKTNTSNQVSVIVTGGKSIIMNCS